MITAIALIWHFWSAADMVFLTVPLVIALLGLLQATLVRLRMPKDRLRQMRSRICAHLTPCIEYGMCLQQPFLGAKAAAIKHSQPVRLILPIHCIMTGIKSSGSSHLLDTGDPHAEKFTPAPGRSYMLEEDCVASL